MTFKILSVIVGLVSILGAWAMSVVLLWGPTVKSSTYSLFDAGVILGAVFLVLNFCFQLYLAWMMFWQDQFLHSKAVTMLAPVIVSVLIIGYNFALGAIKPRPQIVTSPPLSSEDMEKARQMLK